MYVVYRLNVHILYDTIWNKVEIKLKLKIEYLIAMSGILELSAYDTSGAPSRSIELYTRSWFLIPGRPPRSLLIEILVPIVTNNFEEMFMSLFYKLQYQN